MNPTATSSTSTPLEQSGVIMIGVGEMGASKTPGETVKTMALGSCVAVILLEPKSGCVGMVHIALPDSSINARLGKTLPGYFADTGIPALIHAMKHLRCDGEEKNWQAKIVGGANVMHDYNLFNVGKKNILAVKKILRELNLSPRAEDVGKNFSRTVEANVATGRITISCPGRGSWLL